MKIAMIGHKHFMTREGGVERVVSELAPRMKKMGNDVTVYDRFEINKPYKKVNEIEGVTIRHAPTLSYGFLNAFLYSLSATILSLFQHFDIVHYHAIGPSAMIWIQKIFGRRIIVTVHGLDWKRSKWTGFATQYLKFGERMAVKYADEIIVLSESDKEYFKNTYNRNTVLIENGVEAPSFLEPVTLNKIGIKPFNYFLYLGRIVPEKNIDLLIESFLEYKSRNHANEKLIIAGEINKGNEYHVKLKESTKNNTDIIFLGAVDGRMIPELYNHCKAFILPSSIEGMSIALLEALSYGIPCIVSDIPENMAIGKTYTYPFHTGDKQSLIHTMQYIKYLGDITGNIKNQEQIAYIQENFNWDSVAEKTILEYEKVINHGK